MNIYKVERLTPYDYDNYSQFICFAENEEIATNMSPSGYIIDWEKIKEELQDAEAYKYLDDPYYKDFTIDKIEEISIGNGWVAKKSNVKVTLLGNAIKDSKRQIICASYHAG